MFDNIEFNPTIKEELESFIQWYDKNPKALHFVTCEDDYYQKVIEGDPEDPNAVRVWSSEGDRYIVPKELTDTEAEEVLHDTMKQIWGNQTHKTYN